MRARFPARWVEQVEQRLSPMPSSNSPRALGRAWRALRGGCGEENGGEKGILVIDMGSQNTRASMSAIPGSTVQGLSNEGLVATLVQNDMSKLDTPTAVAFRGGKCEVGELAADQPASNAHNTIAYYMPHLGIDAQALAQHLINPAFTPANSAPSSGTAAALVHYKDEQIQVPLELAAALQVAAMAQYARAQIASQGGKAQASPSFQLVLAVPTYFNARQIKALQDASFIAGFDSPVLVSAAEALAHEYRVRHRRDLASLVNASISGRRHVALVDIGHASASVAVVRYVLDAGAAGGVGAKVYMCVLAAPAAGARYRLS